MTDPTNPQPDQPGAQPPPPPPPAAPPPTTPYPPPQAAGYPPPQAPQPGYPQPGYPQPGFPQAGFPQTGPGQFHASGQRVNRARRGPLLAIVAVLVLLAGGFAVRNLTSDVSTGSGTPDGAVEDMFQAISDEDVIGVMEMMDPGERRAVQPFLEDLESNLSRLGITEDVNLRSVPGADLEIENLTVSAQELRPDMTEVTITGGTLSYATEPEEVPLGDALRDIIEANGGEAEVPQESGGGPLVEGEAPFLIATETDGRWHVSLFFTMAEYIRRDEGLALPDASTAVAPQGAGSPEEAVEQMAQAATQVDLRRMISLLPPDEARALQEYAPLFLDDAQADADEWLADEGIEITIDDMQFDTTSVDGGTRVIPTAVTLTFTTYDEGTTTVNIDQDCVELSGESEIVDDMVEDVGDTRICYDELEEAASQELDDEESAEWQELAGLFDGFEPGIIAVEQDGAYYVDPIHTFTDVFTQVLTGIDRADVEEGGIVYRLFTGDLSLFEQTWEDDYYDDEYLSDDDYYDDEDYEDDYYD